MNKRGLGPDSAGQSGDTQGLPENIEELLEEGQSFEAGVLIGVEDVDNHEVAEVETKQVPEDDVPLEYLRPKP